MPRKKKKSCSPMLSDAGNHFYLVCLCRQNIMLEKESKRKRFYRYSIMVYFILWTLKLGAAIYLLYHLNETDLIKYEHYFIMFGQFEYFMKHTRIHWNFIIMNGFLYSILTQLIYATSDDNFEWFAVFAMLSGKIHHSDIGLTDKLAEKITKR
jgi:hypothetical protein